MKFTASGNSENENIEDRQNVKKLTFLHLQTKFFHFCTLPFNRDISRRKMIIDNSFPARFYEWEFWMPEAEMNSFFGNIPFTWNSKVSKLISWMSAIKNWTERRPLFEGFFSKAPSSIFPKSNPDKTKTTNCVVRSNQLKLKFSFPQNCRLDISHESFNWRLLISSEVFIRKQ